MKKYQLSFGKIKQPWEVDWRSRLANLHVDENWGVVDDPSTPSGARIITPPQFSVKV